MLKEGITTSKGFTQEINDNLNEGSIKPSMTSAAFTEVMNENLTTKISPSTSSLFFTKTVNAEIIDAKEPEDKDWTPDETEFTQNITTTAQTDSISEEETLVAEFSDATVTSVDVESVKTSGDTDYLSNIEAYINEGAMILKATYTGPRSDAGTSVYKVTVTPEGYVSKDITLTVVCDEA